MRQITVENGQNIFDIAVQEYGSVEGAAALIADNALADGYATILTGGQILLIKSAPTDAKMLADIKAAGIKPKGGTVLTHVSGFAFGLEPVTVANGGGDNWTFSVPFSSLTLSGTDTMSPASVTGDFWTGMTPTSIVSDTISAATDYTFSARGAGTYIFRVQYHTADGFTVATQLFLMVDGAGTIIRMASFAGIYGVTISGLSISATAEYSVTNCTFPSGRNFIAFNGDFSSYHPMGSSDSLVSEPLPLYDHIYLFFMAPLSPAEWTDVGADINGDVTGSAMTLTINIS
jgi:hypothetical protein